MEQIQTLHPVEGKTNKRISLDKYVKVKDAILSILAKQDLTHTALMEQLFERLKDTFEGGIQWYGETVKLDLEARNMIVRNTDQPACYRLVLTKNPAC